MNNKYLCIILIAILALVPLSIICKISVKAFASNEGSYQYGYQQGSGANLYPGHDNNTCVLGGAVTNTTSCEDGFFVGYKDWCINHAVNCVGNMTLGYLSDVLIKKIWETHQEYQKGYNAADSAISMNVCPMGENGAFCAGWNDYNDEHNGAECGPAYYNYTGRFSIEWIGCPLDTMRVNQMAKPHALLGTWDYVNGTYSGRIVYSDYGNFTLTIPTKNAIGNYKLEGSWGSLGPNILTECYPYGSCENNTIITTSPNHLEFKDNHGNMIHLMKFHPAGIRK